MGFLKDIKEIKTNVQRISKTVDDKIIYKARKYDELKEYLKNIQFNIKIKEEINNLGEKQLVLEYTLPKVTLSFDENYDLIENRVFTSINMLDLIAVEDMIEITKHFPKKKK